MEVKKLLQVLVKTNSWLALLGYDEKDIGPFFLQMIGRIFQRPMLLLEECDKFNQCYTHGV